MLDILKLENLVRSLTSTVSWLTFEFCMFVVFHFYVQKSSETVVQSEGHQLMKRVMRLAYHQHTARQQIFQGRAAYLTLESLPVTLEMLKTRVLSGRLTRPGTKKMSHVQGGKRARAAVMPREKALKLTLPSVTQLSLCLMIPGLAGTARAQNTDKARAQILLMVLKIENMQQDSHPHLSA